MLNGGAAGHRRCFCRLRRMRMNNSSQAERSRFTTGGLELRVAQGLRAAFTNALGCEDLDQIGALLLALTDQFTQLSRIPAVFRQSLERREYPRTRKNAARDRIAQVFVFHRAGALNGRKACIE